jgi:hypothetical protein
LQPADDGHGFTFNFSDYWETQSEFLGMDQRVQQVDAEADSNDQADDRFGHRPPSQSGAGTGVNAHQPEEQKSDDEIGKIGHGAAPPDRNRVFALQLRKRSIRDWGAARKESIRKTTIAAQLRSP